MLQVIILSSITVLCIAIIISVIVKIHCWRKAGREKMAGFISSYFRWYNVYKVQSTTSRRRQQFMRDNNRINLTIWSIISITGLFILIIILELN